MDHTSMIAPGNAADAPITPPDTAPAPPGTPLTQPVSAMERLLAEAGIDTSVLPPPDPSSKLGFSEEVLHIMKHEHGQTDAAMLIRQEGYLYYTKRLRDAPPIGQLTGDDVLLLLSIRTLDNPEITSWKQYKDMLWEKTRMTRDGRNPFLCNWTIKSESQAHLLYKDLCMGANEAAFASDDRKAEFNEIIRSATPEGADPNRALGCAPTENTAFLYEVVDAFAVHLRHFAVSLGENPTTDFEYKWAPTVVLLTGLGYGVLRRVAGQLQELDPDWAGVAMASDAELHKLVTTCRRTSGYPAGLLRVSAERLFRFFEEVELAQLPLAFRMVFVLHLFKFVRYVPGACGLGMDAVLVMFNGVMAVLPILPVGYNAPMNTGSNRGVFMEVCRILGIPADKQKGRNANNTMRNAIQNILGLLRPLHLPRQHDMAEHPMLIAPPCVTYKPKLELRSERPWANHGMRVGPIGGIDPDNGRVRTDIYIEDEDALTCALGFAPYQQSDYDAWKQSLPTEVMPALPSSLFLPLVKNHVDLGHAHGLARALDTIMLLGSSRPELAGTHLGASLRNEFPFVVILPTGSTERETTQQGKTNAARVLGNTLVPNLDVTMVPRKQSAPGDRAVTSNLRDRGTLILDEFQVQSFDGILSTANIQGLLTGATINPGLAGENAGSIGLKYPLFASMKFSNVPKDIRNRQFPIFLDPVTDANRATDAEFRELFTGPLPVRMRLSMALWKHVHKFTEQVKAIPWTTAKGWRFPVHYLVAEHVFKAGDAVVAYLKAAEERCEQQYREAHAQGLVVATGGAPFFDPEWYFNHCSIETLDLLYTQQTHGPLKSADVLKALVEDGDRRDYIRELTRLHKNESGALSAFLQTMDGAVCGDWQITFYDGKDRGSRPRKFVRLIKRKNGSVVPPSSPEQQIAEMVQGATSVVPGPEGTTA